MSQQPQANGTASSEPMVKEPQEPPQETRKRLPSIPDVQNQPVTCARPKQSQNTMVKANTSGYGPFLLEYSIMAEYSLLLKQKTPGCYVIPSAMTPLVWYGMLFIRQGLYQEGVFKFTITIPDNFPDGDCPTLVFDMPVFHPLVDPSTGELDVQRAFPKWRKNVNHIWQILLYARRVFYKLDTKSPFNAEAAILYEQDLDLFKQRVSETIQTSKEKIYDPLKSDDPHCLKITHLDPSVQEDVKQQMLNAKENINEPLQTTSQTTNSKGMSWMKTGSVQIFSKDDQNGSSPLQNKEHSIVSNGASSDNLN